MGAFDEYLERAAQLVFREARCLDERRWDDWLGLYADDAEFWVPGWKNELEPTSDPTSELSLIYISSRRRLQDRVERVRSGLSIASSPSPRTAHILSNIEALPDSSTVYVVVHAISTTHVIDVRFGHHEISVGRCEYLLIPGKSTWSIRRKKVTVLNDPLPPILDFYTI